MSQTGAIRRATLATIASCIVPAIAFALQPASRLACRNAYANEASPNGQWTLTVCPQPSLLSAPGGGSDAPGLIVLRDRYGAVRGVSKLNMVQLFGTFGTPTRWTTIEVARPMVFAMPLRPARNSLERWWDERLWRLKTLLGLITNDEEFR